MGTTTYGPYSVPNEVFTTTSIQAIKARDLKSMRAIETPITARLLATRGQYDGSHTIKMAFNLGPRHSLPTPISLNSQFGELRSVANVQLSPGFDTPFFVAQPAFMGVMDETYQTASAEQRIQLAKMRTDDVAQHLEDSLEKATMRGTTTSGSWVPDIAVQALAGANLINGVDFQGFLEELDSQTNTIHNVAKSSYPATTHPRFHHLVCDFANSVSTTFFDEFIDMQTRAVLRGFDLGKADLFHSEAVIRHIAKVQRTSYLQVNTMDGGAQGYKIPLIMGKQSTPCANMPTNGATTATYPISLAGITFGEGGIQFLTHKDWNMTVVPWRELGGLHLQAKVMFIKLGGQIVNHVPGAHFTGVRGETYS